MLLHFTAISDVLSTMHGIPAGLREVTRSRLKYFQNRSFPLATKTRGKARIGIDDALKLAFAFELLQLGMGPLRAIRLTVTDWPVIRDVMAAAWWRGRQATPSERFVLVIAPQALAEMAVQDDLLNTPLSETVGPRRESSILGGTPGRGIITLDLERLAVDFGAALISENLATSGEHEKAMLLYCESVFCDPDPASWKIDLPQASSSPEPLAPEIESIE
jgi:hypothetical protein